MFQKIASKFTQDDNPRLHRIPFFFLWGFIFALAWYVIYVYELLWYEPRLDRLLSRLKYSTTWGEGVVIGLLFGVTLSIAQTWLIRFRYGFVPKLWLILTIIGAVIAGYWYPRVGLRTGESLIGINWMGVNNTTPVDNLVIDFFAWFFILSLFQAIALFFVNRKSLLLIILGLLAGFVASMPTLYPRFLYGRPFWTLILGTFIQTISSGVIVMHCMANPRAGTSPKRDKNTATTMDGKLTALSFTVLWVFSFFVHTVFNIVIRETWRFMVYYSPTALYENLNLSNSDRTWIYAVIITGISGIFIASIQKWLMKKYTGLSIPYWIILSTIGWLIAGYVSWKAGKIYPRDTIYYFLMGLFQALPVMFQALLINRLARWGWIWIFTGIIAGIIKVWILSLRLPYLSGFYSTFLAILFMTISTAILFIWLQNYLRNPQINEAISVNAE